MAITHRRVNAYANSRRHAGTLAGSDAAAGNLARGRATGWRAGNARPRCAHRARRRPDQTLIAGRGDNAGRIRWPESGPAKTSRLSTVDGLTINLSSRRERGRSSSGFGCCDLSRRGCPRVWRAPVRRRCAGSAWADCVAAACPGLRRRAARAWSGGERGVVGSGSSRWSGCRCLLHRRFPASGQAVMSLSVIHSPIWAGQPSRSPSVG